MSSDEQGVTGPRRFRRRPLEVTAIQWTGGNLAHVQVFAAGCVEPPRGGEPMLVWNSEERDWIRCPEGHWVARGILGEFYPVSPAGLEAGFEQAD